MYLIIGGDGKEYGPVPADQVRAWVSAGRANLDTQVKAVGTNEWKRVRDLPDFGGGLPSSPPFIPAGEAASPAADSELAGRWTRLGAWFLDGVVGAVLIGPGFAMMLPWLITQGNAALGHGLSSDYAFGTLGSGIPFADMPRGAAAVFATGWLILMAIQIVLLSTRGQSVGKIVAGIRIVRLDGQKAGFVHAWLLRNFLVRIFYAVPKVGPLFYLTDVLFIFSESRRCVHDRIAGTRVVKAA